MNMARVLKWLGLTALILGVGAFSGWEAMKRNWIQINSFDVRSEGILVVGDLVPDLEMTSVDGEGRSRLSDFYKLKPLVLIFGSYT